MQRYQERRSESLRACDSPDKCQTPRETLREQVEIWKKRAMQLEGENSHELSRLQGALNQALNAVNKVRDESAGRTGSQ